MIPEFFFPDKTTIIPDLQETARYLGYRKSLPPDVKVSELIKLSADQMHPLLFPKTVYQEFDLQVISANEDKSPVIRFADSEIHSIDLARNLENCTKIFIFAATLGPQVDMLIRKTQVTDPVMASIHQSTGAMFIEKVVDEINNRIKELALHEGFKTKPRFSPGFGDVPLQIQKDFFRLLPCTKIGLTLMDSLIMAPEKSVTAFVGLYKSPLDIHTN